MLFERKLLNQLFKLGSGVIGKEKFHSGSAVERGGVAYTLYVYKRAAGADNDIYVEHMEVLLYGEARGISEMVGYFLNEWVYEVGNFGSLEVLKDCSFRIESGEFICVVGPTGCGKTTFLNLLTCLIEPTSGEILLDGERANPKKHNLSFVFQESSAFPWLTVEKNIRFGLEMKKVPEEEIKERTDTVISLLGLNDYRNSYPGEMSASAEQKIAIGRAFATHPDLLLMDEPYGQMDIKMRFYLENEVIRLWQALGSTVIFITHNVEEAVYLADRIIVLTPKPCSVREIVTVDLPRPRNVSDDEFIKIRSHVTDAIKWW